MQRLIDDVSVEFTESFMRLRGTITSLVAAVSVSIVASSTISAGTQQGEIRFERLGTKNGLSHNSVYAIHQDRQGFLWFGTADGLNRYDGREFRVWRHDPGSPDSLPASEVKAVLEDRRGVLWVGTSDGIARFNRANGRFIPYSLEGILPDTAPKDALPLYEDRSGTVWAGLTGALVRYDSANDRFEGFVHDPQDPDTLAAGIVYGIQEDDDGALWVLSQDWPSQPATLSRLDRESGRFQRFVAPEDWDTGGLLVGRNGTFWINVAGLGTFDPIRGRFRRPLLNRSYPPLWGLQEDRDGFLWITTTTGFLRADLATGEVSPPLLPSGDRLSAFAMTVVEDRAGTLWFGTRGGLYKWDRRQKAFAHRQREAQDPSSLSGDQVSAVLEDSSGTLWVGTYGSGLNRLDDAAGPVVRYRHDPDDPTSLCHDTIWHLAEDRAGMLWLGVGNGLCSYDRATKRFLHHELGLPVSEAQEAEIRFIVFEASGRSWLASGFGLVSFDPATGTSTLYPPTGDARGPGGEQIFSLFLEKKEEDKGVLWFGLGGLGLGKLDLGNGEFTHYPVETERGGALHGEGIFDIRQDRAGRLWLASAAGLLRFDPDNPGFEHYSIADGLPGSIVYSLLVEDDGRLWLGTSRGLSRFDPREQRGAQFRNFDLFDGIGSLEFNRHAAWRGSDGHFYFGGMSGLTVFQPREIRDNTFVPPLALTRIQVWTPEGERELSPWGVEALRLSHRENSFSFEFAALSFTSPEKNRYAYKLEGFEDDWIDSGSRAFARYSRVPPGDYVFRLRGSNNDGLWNRQGLSLSVTITPPFWQTWWFRMAVVAAIVAALAALYRFRVKKLLEVEHLRLRIAADLHDDLSSDLSGIALTMESIEQLGALDKGQRKQIARVRRRSLSMLDRLRDIVWYVNPEHDSMEATVRRMRGVAETLLEGKRYTFEESLSGRSDAIPLGFRRNFYLLYKEALHNIARHSEAERVSISLTQADGRLVLRVSDDGIGFDETQITAGQGLRGMRRRAEEMAADFRIDSRSGVGTTIRLSAKIARTRDDQAA